jgi:hypothetical protein
MMKGKTIISMLAAVLLVPLVMVGCESVGGEQGSGGDPALIGTWDLTQMKIGKAGYFAPVAIDWSVQLHLYPNGAVSLDEVSHGNSASRDGGWSVTGDTLNIQAGPYNWTGPYTVNSARFILFDVPKYDGQVPLASFIFSRQ